MQKNPRPPAHLKGSARTFWKGVQSEYRVVDTAGLRLLTTAAECLQRADDARKQIDDEGATVRDRFGQSKAHPLLSVEKDARALAVTAIKALGLDLEPVRDRPGRPGGY